jgi:hypothetical protein
VLHPEPTEVNRIVLEELDNGVTSVELKLDAALLAADQDIAPITLSPLRRQNPREEPGALAAHAGISIVASRIELDGK